MKVAVISSFPKLNAIHGTGTVGGASYTKNLLLSLKNSSLSFDVFADLIDENITSEQHSQSIVVHRVWKRGNISSLNNLYTILQNKNYSTLLVSLEAYMFGSFFHLGIFLVYLALLKLKHDKNIIIIMHQVPDSTFFDTGSLIKSVPQKILARVLYKLILWLSNSVVVFEDYLKEILGSSDNINVIPHAVEPVRRIPKAKARKHLGINQQSKVVLYFGFLSEYKGLSRLIEIWDNTDKKMQLIIAGGPNKQHEHNEAYREFITEIAHDAALKDITLTGFVNEEDIPYLYSAADCIILPYDRFFSSSGPLSLAFAYQQPVILSEPLHQYEFSHDFGGCMERHQIGSMDMFIRMTPKGLNDALARIFKNHNRYEDFSTCMKTARSWKKIAPRYEELLRIYEK